MDYTILKKVIDRKSAIAWMIEDQNDEFWLDPIYWADLENKADDYIERTKHKFSQIETMVSIQDKIPKSNGMWREGIWLNPGHRIIYLACLKWLIGKTDPHIPNTVYSYRKDTPGDDTNTYPFKGKIARWKTFANDFRRSALEESIQYVLITDLSAYYDHINIAKLQDRIRLLLHGGKDENDEVVIEMLGKLWRLWSKDDFGIPQNYDPSSYFGSLYLHTVDTNMAAKRYVYFRYVDDMRICCQSERHALRALHDLQDELQKDRLYLNGSKTKIVKKGTPEFDKLIDVEDDVTISECEQVIRSGVKNDIIRIIPVIKDRIFYNTQPNGDDRKLRAYINRALDLMDYADFKDVFNDDIKATIISRLSTNPDRTDYWVKFLAAVPDKEVISKTFDLVFKEKVLFNWQRYNMIRLLISNGMDLSSIVARKEEVRSAYVNSPSDLEKGLILILLGRLSNPLECIDLYQHHFSQQLGYFQQRCLLIALFDVDPKSRDKIYEKALQINQEHKELIDYLKSSSTVSVGLKSRVRRTLPPQPKILKPITKSGVGFVRGVVTKYRMSFDAYDYE